MMRWCVMQYNLNDSYPRLVKSIVVTKTQYKTLCAKTNSNTAQKDNFYRFYLCFERSFKWYFMLKQATKAVRFCMWYKFFYVGTNISLSICICFDIVFTEGQLINVLLQKLYNLTTMQLFIREGLVLFLWFKLIRINFHKSHY